MTLLSRPRRASIERYQDEMLTDDLRRAWRTAAEGVGLVHKVDTVSGATIVVPRIRQVFHGPPTGFMVELLPGMLPTDVEAVALRLAPALGVQRLRVTGRGDLWCRIDLLAEDPLSGTVTLPSTPGTGTETFLGQDEAGRTVVGDWQDLTHGIVQGCSGSGKSVWTYGTLVQAAGRPEVLITGCDPSGLLWRPFKGTRHAPWQVSGLRSIEAHAKLLGRLVDEMDRRIEDIPEDRDSVTTSTDLPLAIVLLEEYAGLLRAADQYDTKLGKQIRAHVARLLAEGRKAGIRVLIIVQRAEAAIVGALERAQCALRLSFRTDNRASVELLHPGAPADLAEEHTTAPPGIGLLTLPGRPLMRIKAAYLGSYADFAAAVRSRTT